MKAPNPSARYKRLLLFLLLCLSLPGLSQDYASIWKLETLNTSTEKNKVLLQSLNRSGYQLDLKALQQGELVLTFDNIAAIGKALCKRGDQLMLTSDADTLLTISREELRDQLYPQFQEKERGNTDKKNFYRALRGKRRTIRSKEKPYRLHFGQINTAFHPYSFIFSRKNKPHSQLIFNTVPAQQISEMPYLEFTNCSPFDRESYFRDISRRWYSGTIPPFPYSPPKGVQRTRTFKLYFEQNKAEYSKKDMSGILQFLTDTLYNIEKAEIKAWASVEGNPENNTTIQEKRAKILIQALEKYNSDSIPYTVITEENWTLFYEQLQKKGIDSTYRSQEGWKEVFSDPKELAGWEPLLAQQRKAEIKLFVTVKLTAEQKHQLAYIQFHKLAASYKSAPRQQKPSLVKAMLGIRNYMEQEVAAGRLEAQKLCSLYAHSSVYEYTLINFYELADRFDKGEPLYCDFQELALHAFNNIKSLYSFQHALSQNGISMPDPKVYGDLVSVQAYLYQKIIQKKLPSQLACALYFSDDPKYYHLYLNYLKFTNALKADPSLDYDCRTVASTGEKTGDTFDWRAVDADSRYYYMLKKLVMESRKLDMVWRTDWMEEFDLYEFLLFNIYYWDPERSYFFDQEIGVKDMAAHTKKLLSSLKRLCPHQAYGLAVAFHAKAVQEAYQQQQRTEQLEESITFIERFFLQHADALDGDQALYIVRQLLLANSYSLRNERGRFALDLLERVAIRKGLTADQKELYFELTSKLGVTPKIEH